ncbi:jg21639, partial [Pararge aegeria aegeria]
MGRGALRDMEGKGRRPDGAFFEEINRTRVLVAVACTGFLPG